MTLSVSTPPPDETVPRRLVGGRYEILRALAMGGMGTVYVARHVLTQQKVALKVIDRRFGHDPASVERFLREVSVASKVEHPGIVKVFDAGVDEDVDGARWPYLAMELLTGGDLANQITGGRVTMLQALRWVQSMLGALGAAHAAGVVHRDLKPENIFIEGPGDREGVVRLLDFGIARDLEGPRTATMVGQALGTVYDMAPEQARDASSVTARADVYAVGVIMYQLFTGAFPYDGDNPHAVVIRAQMDEHQPVGARAPWLDPRLAALVEACLRRRPEERPADASALGASLAGLLADPELGRSLGGRRVQPASFMASPAPSQHLEDPFANYTPKDEGPAPPGASGTPQDGPTAPAEVTAESAPEAPEEAEGPTLRRSIAIVGAIVPVVVALVLLVAQALHRGSPPAQTAPSSTASALPVEPRAPAPAAPAAPASEQVPAPVTVSTPLVTARETPRARGGRALRGALPPAQAQAPAALAPPPPAVAPPPTAAPPVPAVAPVAVAPPAPPAPRVQVPPVAPPVAPPTAPAPPVRPPPQRPPEGEGPQPFTTF
ncbi:MAG: protein kinase [Deltaproteobacteria bacterium]|nr:protein kinase [Deltaproteobacteria bacterium]